MNKQTILVSMLLLFRFQVTIQVSWESAGLVINSLEVELCLVINEGTLTLSQEINV